MAGAPGPLRMVAVAINVLLAAALTAAGAAITLSWVDSGDAPRWGMLSLVGALWLIPAGLLFALAAVGISRRWKAWPLLQLLPLAYPVAFGWLLQAIG